MVEPVIVVPYILFPEIVVAYKLDDVIFPAVIPVVAVITPEKLAVEPVIPPEAVTTPEKLAVVP